MFPHHVQDPADDSPRHVSVGYTTLQDSIAEAASSSEKVAVAAGAPPGLASRPPIVSPSTNAGALDRTAPHPSLGLISPRTRNRSAAASRTPRTPVNYGFGRRTSAAADSTPSTPYRCSPTTRTTLSPQPQHPTARSRSSPRVDPPPPTPPVPRPTR